MTAPQRAQGPYVAPLGMPAPLLGIPVIESELVPPGKALLLGQNVVVLSTARPARVSRWRRFRRWLRALPHRLCPC